MHNLIQWCKLAISILATESLANRPTSYPFDSGGGSCRRHVVVSSNRLKQGSKGFTCNDSGGGGSGGRDGEGQGRMLQSATHARAGHTCANLRILTHLVAGFHICRRRAIVKSAHNGKALSEWDGQIAVGRRNAECVLFSFGPT